MSQSSTAALQAGFARSHMTVTDLWLAAAGIGGFLNRTDVAQIADGRRAATAAEHDVLASALNDCFVGRHEDHPVRYWRDLGLAP